MDKKARILFVYPNERGMSVIPPAIAILSQLLKQNDHTTDLFDTTFYEFDDDISLGNLDQGLENTLQVRPVTSKEKSLNSFKRLPLGRRTWKVRIPPCVGPALAS